MILWILQDNQVPPALVQFLKALKTRVSKIAKIQFAMSTACTEIPEMVKPLKPVTFNIEVFSKEATREGVEQKKRAVNGCFSDGLDYRKVLIQDDFGGGRLFCAQPRIETDEEIDAIILQIPVPLGASELEDRTFYSWVYYAHAHGIPVIGYELLSLNTRWTFAADLLSAVITSREESYNNLLHNRCRDTQPVWLLPPHEGRFFAASVPTLWSQGISHVYHWQEQYQLAKKPVICIPHNVAMIYEYRKLVEFLSGLPEIHLMFTVGPDQIRDGLKHHEIIEKTCGPRMEEKRVSYSFHNLHNYWEIAMATCVVACSEGFFVQTAHLHNIPAIVYDPCVRPGRTGTKIVVEDITALQEEVGRVINNRRICSEFAKIFQEIKNAKNTFVHSAEAS